MHRFKIIPLTFVFVFVWCLCAKADEVIYQETMESYNAGDYPAGWENLYSGKSGAVSDEVAYNGTKSFKVVCGNNWGRTDYILKPFSFEGYDKVSLEFAFYLLSNSQTQYNHSVGFGINEPKYAACGISFGKINAYGGESPATEIQDAEWNTWYHVKILVDVDACTMDFYLNGTLRASDITIHQDLSQINNINLQCPGYLDATVYFDDFVLSRIDDDPAQVSDLIEINGIDNDGTNWWIVACTDDTNETWKLFKVASDMTTILDSYEITYDTFSEALNGVACKDGSVYVRIHPSGPVYQLDPSDGSYSTSSYSTRIWGLDMAFYDSLLWQTRDQSGGSYEVWSSAGDEFTLAEITDRKGITSDGSNLYIGDYYNPNIYRVNSSGEVLGTVDVLQGAQPLKISYLSSENAIYSYTRKSADVLRIVKVADLSQSCTDADGDGYYAESGCGTEVDCDDSDEDVNPGMTEACNDGKDNDCDDDIDCNDTDCASSPGCSQESCTDADGDGYYAESGCGTEVDCDDSDEDVNPGMTEACNDGKDNDCDDNIDCNDTDCSSSPGCSQESCTDADGDGYYAESGCGTDVDCDDSEAGVHPGAQEVCDDGVDNDCDGDIDTKDTDCQEKPPIGPNLSANPLSIDFGTSDTTATLSISNTGSGTMEWTASVNQDWLSVQPESGETQSGPDTIVLTCSRAGLLSKTYSATIAISSNGGNKSIPVLMEVPEGVTADFSGCTDMDEPGYVQFTDQSAGDVVSWEWTFGDGGTSYEQNPLYEYTKEGEYDVTLTVTGSEGNTDSKTGTDCMRVGDIAIEADFDAAPTSGTAPLTVQFTDSSSGPVSTSTYSWTFGDGGTSDDENPTHTYNSAGTYKVSLTVSGAGASDTETKANLITVTEAESPLEKICAMLVSVEGRDGADGHLETLRDFRDLALSRSPSGMLLTSLYYYHVQEVVEILIGSPELSAEVGDLMEEIAPRLNQVLKGKRTAVTQEELRRITNVLQKLSKQGSPGLKYTLGYIMSRLERGGLLEQYGILTVEE